MHTFYFDLAQDLRSLEVICSQEAQVCPGSKKKKFPRLKNWGAGRLFDKHFESRLNTLTFHLLDHGWCAIKCWEAWRRGMGCQLRSFTHISNAHLGEHHTHFSNNADDWVMDERTEKSDNL